MGRSAKNVQFSQVNLIDFGSSATKSMTYRLGAKITAQIFKPYVVEMSDRDFQQIVARQNLNAPIENQAWVSYGGRQFAVRNLVQVHQGQMRVHRLKQDSIVPRALVAIFPTLKDFDGTMMVLGQLPAGEFVAREELTGQPTEALQQFSSPSGLHKVKIKVTFMPERAGIAAYQEQRQGVQAIARSSKWGFFQLVREVSQMFPEAVTVESQYG